MLFFIILWKAGAAMAVHKLPDRLSETEDTSVFGFSVTRKTLREGYPLHWHDFYEFEWITGGSGTHIINGTEQPVRPGDLIVVSPVDLHSIALPEESLQHITVHFNEMYLTETAKRIIACLPRTSLHFPPTDRRALNEIFAYLAAIERRPLPQKEQIIKNRIEAILLYCVQNTAAAVPGSYGFLAAVDYIDQHFRTDVTLQAAAKQAGLSANAFSARFHKVMGITFQEYLIKKRLAWAHAMLKSTDLSVSQIALESGFHSHSHFTRSFQKRYGKSPAEARQVK